MLHCRQKNNCEFCNVVLLTYFDKMKKKHPNAKYKDDQYSSQKETGQRICVYTIAKDTPIITHK